MRYSNMINNYRSLNLTKMDVMDDLVRSPLSSRCVVRVVH